MRKRLGRFPWLHVLPLQSEPRDRVSFGKSNAFSKEVSLLGEVGQLIQACRTMEEFHRVAGSSLERLLPGTSGAIYLTDEVGDCLRRTMAWGATPPTSSQFAPNDCWSLRCGRAHTVRAGLDPVACTHIDLDQGNWHLCLPLVAQGEALGVLHFCAEENRRHEGIIIDERRFDVCVNVSQTLSLAVANIRLAETLKEQAIRDPLTGLFNRRYFQETFKRELHRSSRDMQPLAIVMADVDHFKRFNDTFGHDAGDAALRTVGEILRSRMRAGDVASRHGGEEFALIFPGLTAEAAERRMEEIRHDISTHTIRSRGQQINPVTISAGAAVYPDHACDTETLIHLADQALYRSKAAGRNCLTMADQPRESVKPALLRIVRAGGD
jgi:diguanylate cyclase (GGDEF)-like protein